MFLENETMWAHNVKWRMQGTKLYIWYGADFINIYL